jgi:DNA invertase Pin-like site-specific DNA recombinase
MNELTKIGASHLSRDAYVYLRQSTAAQVEHNRESTQRQYALAARATALGWPQQQVVIIDEDLGVSGSGVVERSGFARLTAEVGLGHVGIVLGLEVSRLARDCRSPCGPAPAGRCAGSTPATLRFIMC